MASNKKFLLDLPVQGDTVYVGERFGDLGYTLDKPIEEGGESFIYPGNGGHIFKIYKEHMITDERIAKITKMIEGDYNVPSNICWPKDLVFEPSTKREIIGFTMKNVASVHTGEQRCKTLTEIICSSGTPDPSWNWKRAELVRICIKISQIFNELHNQKILMGDVNPKNILVNKGCDVYFIDTDSYQFDNFVCPVGIPVFTSPRIHLLHRKSETFSTTPRTLEDEYYATAMLYYQILFLGSLPFPSNGMSISHNTINKVFRHSISTDNTVWGNLTPTLRKAFESVFVHDVYPTDAEWTKMFEELYGDIVDGYSSNDIYPIEFIHKDYYKKIKYTDVKCIECGQMFSGLPKSKRKTCYSCKVEQIDCIKNTVFGICSSCGIAYSVNNQDSKQLSGLCPDCAEKPDLLLDNKLKTVDDLKKAFEDIHKNLEKENDEDYI